MLQRQGRSSRPRETPADTTHAPVTAYEPGYRPVDVNYLPQLAAETTRRDRCVAMDRATRGVCIPIKANKTAASAQSLLAAWHRACPLKIGNRLTDNGQDFTERRCGSREKTASGDHECDQRCQALGIEQRLTPPRRPPTTGMVERFKGRIAAVLAPPRCNSAPDLETPLLRDAGLDNHHLPQQALGQVTPSEAMKKGYAQQPEAFLATPRNRPGPDSYFDGSMSGCGGVTWRNSRSRMPRR